MLQLIQQATTTSRLSKYKAEEIGRRKKERKKERSEEKKGSIQVAIINHF